jgi:nitric oxide synthase oxygenase domain/subunit
MKEIPEELIIYVKITHEEHKEVFEKLNLKWYGAPALSTMVLELGGIEYTACPFNGWYMSTEIAIRNFTDIHRYDLSEKIAILLGLNV